MAREIVKYFENREMSTRTYWRLLINCNIFRQAPMNNENAPALDFFDDEEIKKVVVRSANDLSLNLHDVRIGKWIPSPTLAEEKQLQEEVEETIADDREVIIGNRQGRFYNYITVLATSTSTTTSTSTSTIGTVGITGTKSACAGTSITEYFSTCG